MDRSRAIVLHQIKYSETSIILKIYTEKDGLLSFIVKGVRGKRGKFRSAQFQVLNLLEINYKEAKKSRLRHIIDLKISEPFTELLFNPVKRSIAMFISELIQHCIKEEEPNPELFNFLHSYVHWLDLNQGNCSHFHLLFMMKLTKHLGFYPMTEDRYQGNYFDLQQGGFSIQKPLHAYYIDSKVLKAWVELIDCKLEALDSLNFSNELKRSLLKALIAYYKLHLIHFKELNSHRVLHAVFNDE